MKRMLQGTVAKGSLAAVAVAWLLSAAGCDQRQEPVPVRLEKREALPAPVNGTEAVLRIGIGSMITPRQGYIYYQRLLDYTGRKLGMRVVAVDPKSYEEMNAQIEAGGVDAAFVCGGPYVEGKERFGLQILAVPEVSGRTVYHSYLIVPKGSAARSYADLRGKTFAFTDPKSNSGMIYPAYVLARMGERPEGFFRRFTFTRAHDTSIRAVAEGVADGAAVDSLIFDYLKATEPALAARVQVVEQSPPFGIPPVVVGSKVSPELRGKLSRVLLEMHADPEGREILKGMMIDRFVPANDAAYDSIREMRRYLAASGLLAGTPEEDRK